MNKDKRKEVIGKQYKTFDIKEYQFDKDSRTISGYAAIFGNVDKASDMLIKGCFSKSIRERGPESAANDKIIFLWMHRMDEPLGRITKLVEDDKGLYFEAIIDQIELGDRALIQLESGTINQFSFGFEYVWNRCEWIMVGTKDVFRVDEVILYEISAVSIGCNGETEYTGLKSTEDVEDANAKLQDEITNTIKDLPINKKSALQGLFSKTWALAKTDPIESKKNAHESINQNQAEKGNNFLAGIKFNN